MTEQELAEKIKTAAAEKELARLEFEARGMFNTAGLDVAARVESAQQYAMAQRRLMTATEKLNALLRMPHKHE